MESKRYNKRYNKPERNGSQSPSEVELATAILTAACEDYIAGLKNLDSWQGRGVCECAREFFLSDRFKMMCSLDPDELMRLLDEKAAKMTSKPEIKKRAEWWGIAAPRKQDEFEKLIEREDDVWELAEDGYTKAEMAEKMGVARSTMDRFIESRGMMTETVSMHAAEHTKTPQKKRAGNE